VARKRIKTLNLEDYPGVFGHVSGNTACDSYYSKHGKKNTTYLFFGRLDRLLGGAKHAMPSMKHIQRQAICDLRHIYTDSLQLCNIFLPLRNALTTVK